MDFKLTKSKSEYQVQGKVYVKDLEKIAMNDQVLYLSVDKSGVPALNPSVLEINALQKRIGSDEIETPLFYQFSGGTRPLTGGIQCRRLPDDRQRPKSGTLGYIATKMDTGDPVLLSCEHVFIFQRHDERLVFQPDFSKCLGIYYNDVGTVINGVVNNVPVAGEAERFFIDAAIASVHGGTGTRRHIPNVGNITGSANIINTPTNPPIILKKMGAETDYTEGEVESVSADLGPVLNFIKIKPIAGKTFTYRVRRKIDPDVVDQVLVDFPNQAFQGTATLVDAAEKIVEFVSEVFAIPGDSGAQLVNQTGQIVGMVFAGDMFEARAFHEETQRWRIVGIPKGPAYGCHIQPVLEYFGLRIDPSTGPTYGKQVAVPGASVTSEDPAKYTDLNAKLELLEEEFEATEQGRELNRLIRSHFREVVQLVHHCRPVKVVWHRLNGPAFVASFFRSISEPGHPFPRENDGIPAITILQHMDQALSENGSGSLNQSIDKHRDMIYHLYHSSHTINELISNLKAECPVS